MILMLSGGTALEQFATRRASSILEALARRMPSVAHRRERSAIVSIGLNDIALGDSLVVFPHELCPVDGVVTDGHGWMDESYLSGEPFQMPKVLGAQVLSGSINGDSALTIQATRLPIDSRYSRIMRVMQEAEAKRPRLRRLGDRLGAWYTPAALALAALGWAMSGSAHRFLAVIVIATPCPLLIAIPVAVIGAISLAARRGIIIKNPAMLERIDTSRTVIFDKTGTLTYGKPSLTDIICAPGFARDEVLRLTACLEQYSKHPLACYSSPPHIRLVSSQLVHSDHRPASTTDARKSRHPLAAPSDCAAVCGGRRLHLGLDKRRALLGIEGRQGRGCRQSQEIWPDRP